jgi:gluconate 2-dehydrogenase gamma chain
MNRRDTLKAIGIGSLSAGALLAGCNPNGGSTSATDPSAAVNPSAATDPATTAKPATTVDTQGRQPFEIARDKALLKETYFDPHEMATITILADLIIPRDEHSGSASDAKVPAFIEFLVKDEPEHQLPMRGGLRWLDLQCLTRFNTDFKSSAAQQQLEMLHDIAYPMKASPAMAPGVAFFNKMRDLTAMGFFTSKMGIGDLGYQGNRPGQWTGVPPDVLKKYGLENV